MSNKLHLYQPSLFNMHSKSFYFGLKGALYGCIKDHGPITRNFVPSALKRIFGAIKCHNKNFARNSGCSNNEWLAIYKEEFQQKIDKDGNVTIPWDDLKSIINKCIERGEYIQYFEKNFTPPGK